MKMSPAFVAVSAALALGALAGACGGSSTESAPADPADHAPLPPLTSSPLGELVDHQAKLHLSADQVQRIEALDHQLTAENLPLERQVLDAQEANEERSARAVEASDGSGSDGDDGGGHHRRGGRRQQRQRPDHTVPGPDEAVDSTQVRAAHARIAHNRVQSLTEALCVLSPDQRTQARQILFDAGYSVPDQTDCTALPSAVPGGPGTIGQAQRPAQQAAAAPEPAPAAQPAAAEPAGSTSPPAP